MFIALDKKGVVILANAKASEILELLIDEIIGKNWFDHFIPSYKNEEIKEIL